MNWEIIQGILIPFIGTTVGAAFVLFMRRDPEEGFGVLLNGFAAGIMVAASVWSLLIPAEEQCAGMGSFAFLPAAVGLMAGVGFLIATHNVISLMDKLPGRDKGSGLMIFAVTLHNLPEGMAVGAVCAGVLYGETDMTAAAALALGIAIQNLPEGAIISMPLHAGGLSRKKAFLCGTLSGAVEPVGALLTIAAAGLVIPAMPYLLGFAAGAMLYVVTAELVPSLAMSGRPTVGAVIFFLGFIIMMSLDIAFG